MTGTVENESDETLAARARSGDRIAFETLIKRHKEALYRFSRRSIGNADDAYDVVQNTFIAAWRGLGRYDPGRPFAPWLRRIALNKCRDFGRRQSVRRLLLRAYASEPQEPPHLSPDCPDRETELLEGERLTALDQAVARLPALYKEPLLLTTAAGLSHQEAAEILNTTPKAIEMRLYRARQKLKGFLEEG